jgi:DHA2 family multidrug resistance protein-like MFS transporter
VTEPTIRLRAGRRAWIGLGVLGLPTILLALDLSILYLALPRLSADLGATNTEQLWITDIYGFVTAGFLATMGTLGDRIGRRRLLLMGAAAFGAASILAAYSTSVAMLIGARALMGLAGATLMPSTLALITNMFRDPAERATAIAAWTSCFMVGAAVGPVVGGTLLEHFWWGALFLLGVPVMVLLLVTAPFLLPEYKDDTAARLDLASVVLSLAAILPLIYAGKVLAVSGVTIVPVVAATVGIAASIAFVARQRRIASPLLDLRLFRNRPFTASLFILMVGLATQSGIVLLISEHLQVVDDLSPVRAGWALMPASFAMVIGCIAAPIAARRIRPGWLIAAGLTITAAGYVLLAQIDGARDLRLLIVGAILVFFGIGPMAVFSQDLIVGSVPPERAGTAAALSETSGDLGIALGVAVVGSISTAVYVERLDFLPWPLPTGVAQLARESIGGAAEAARRLPSPLGDELLHRAQSAFTAGLHAAAVASAVVNVGLAVISVMVLSRTPSSTPARSPQSPPPPTTRARHAAS